MSDYKLKTRWLVHKHTNFIILSQIYDNVFETTK